MIVDPVQAFKATPTFPLVTSTASPSTTILPDYERQAVGETGARTLWVVFVVMLVSSIVFIGMSWNIPISKRLYHVITTLITIFATLSYFAMANGEGVSYHHITVVQKNKHVPDTTIEIDRQVFWARYVDWSLTTPLLLLDLAILAGLNGGNILIAVVADLIMVLTGLFAAFGSEETPSKWGWYGMACVAYLAIVWQLAVHGRAKAASKGGKVGSFFAAISLFTLVIWTVYPIIWGIADGARRVSVDVEIIAYAVLDILAKPVFGAWLLFTHASIPETNVDVGGFWAHGFNSEGTIRVGDDEDGA